MKFPKRVRHKGQTVTIYGKSKSYQGYRVAWHVAGQRKLERFRTYGEAKRRADSLAKELAKCSHATALSAKQAADALPAATRLPPQLLFVFRRPFRFQHVLAQRGRSLRLLAQISG